MSRPRLVKKVEPVPTKNLGSVDVEIEKLNRLEQLLITIQNQKEDLDNLVKVLTDVKLGTYPVAHISIQSNSKSYACAFNLSLEPSSDRLRSIILYMIANIEDSLVKINEEAKAVAATLNLELVAFPKSEFDT